MEDFFVMSNSIPDTPKLTAEAVITQLRSMQSQIEGVSPLTQDQRRQLRMRVRQQPKSVVDASINVIGVLENLSQAIGQPLDEVRQLQDDTLRWEAVADEARAFLKGLEGANLVRRQRLALIAVQVYTIGSQLARDPAKAVLVPHLEEVKRLKVASRRKKAAPGDPLKSKPKPKAAPAPAHDPSVAPQA
jgi:hypothetical protein